MPVRPLMPSRSPVFLVAATVLGTLLPGIDRAGSTGMLGAQEPAPSAVFVTGVVREATPGNAAIAGAYVLVDRPVRTAVTDVEGRFRLGPLPPGRHAVRVEAPGFRPAEVRVEVPTEPADAGGNLSVGDVRLTPTPFRLEGVTVTASPLRGTAVYQPAAAFAGEELQRRMGASLGEALDGEPGLAMRSFGPAPARPVIRGLDGDRVLVLQNGERTGDLAETAPDHAITMDPLGAERVEVVRGPASLLYGTSALGGVVNVLSRDVPRDWRPGVAGRVALQAATATRMGVGAAEVVQGTERMALAVRGSLRESGDLSTPEGRLRGTSSESRTGGLGWAMRGPGVQGGLAVAVLSHDYGLPEEPGMVGEEVRIRLDRTSIHGRVSHDRDGFIGNVELRANASRYAHDEVDRVPEGDGVLEEVGLSFRQDVLSTSLLARHGSWGPVGQGGLGVNVLLRDLEVGGTDALTPDNRSAFLGAFAFQEIPLDRRFRLQAGVRGEWQRMRARPNDRFPASSDAMPPAAIREATLSGSIGLHLRPADGWEVGIQAARAHRAPAPEELLSDAPHLGTGRYEIGDPQLSNEIGHGLDLFARHEGARVQAELALFANRIDGFVVLAPDGQVDPASGYAVYRYRSEDAALAGGEASLTWRSDGGLGVRLAADHVRGSLRGEETGPLPFMPPLRASIRTEYDAGRWWSAVEVRGAARQTRVAPGEVETPGYALVGLAGGIRLDDAGGHLVVLRLDNALDRRYRDHLSRVDHRAFPMPGRNLTIVYRREF